jgi:hypothetical protein
MRYFGQFDVDGIFFKDCLYRYRNSDELILEEVWNPILRRWETTTLLTGMLIHGECTLSEITSMVASQISQAAVEGDEINHVS